MDGARWEQIQNLFHETVERPAGEQLEFLKAACAGDERMLSEVLALVEEDAQGDSLVDRDVGQIARDLLKDSAGAPPFNRIGPYRVLNLLGEGGMGVVYLAERDDLGSQVAIKVLRDAWMSPARRDRFSVERRTLAQLNHPSIARLYDADSLTDGTPWFAMEFVEGKPITDYCRAHTFTAAECLRVFRSVCEAVDYAHKHAIIHRDLKPSNILVKEDGTSRLLDFGISKQLDPDTTPGDRTRTGLRLMTTGYAAPEQIRGEAASIQSDVYSLGVILYELLAGRPPYDPEGRSLTEWESLILSQDPAKPSAAGASRAVAGDGSWADLDVLCLTAMHKDPARRYRSVEALIRDIDHYLNGEPLEARPDTLRYRAGKFIHRNAKAVAAAAAVFVVVLGLVVFYTVRLATARNAALAQAARTQRIQQFMLNLFNGGDVDAGPAGDLRVVSLIDRGVQEARLLSAEPAVQADLYQTLGGVYRKLGKLDQADALLQLALNQRRAIPNGSRADIAESQVALGLLRLDQAKLDEAESLIGQGLNQIKRERAPFDPAVLKATTALGKVFEVRGQYAQGIATMEAAVANFKGPETAEFADALGELADNHYYAGHAETSDSLNQRVLAIDRRLYGDAHPKVADTLVNLGASQFDRGHYKEAERFDREALAIEEKFYGPDHPETASSLTLVGRALVFQNRFDEAEPILRRALEIQERVHGPSHPAVASALNELGNIASKQRRYGDAEATFQRVVEIYRTLYHDHHYLIGIAESNLATVYASEKEYARAEVLYRDAIRRFTETQSAEHLNTGIARIRLGHTLLMKRRYQEAEPETLAGYRILSKQASPSVSWLTSARKDLMEIYGATNQAEKARELSSAGR